MGYDPVLGSRFDFDAEDLSAELLQAPAPTEGAPHRVHHLRAPDGAVPLSLERLGD